MNDTMTIPDTALTSTDVKALKNADSICFDHLRDGTGQIRAILRAEHSGTGFEQVRTITVHHSRVESYAESAPAYTAFHSLSSAKYDNVAQTLVRHLRTGAEVALVWTRDNNNSLINAASWHFDMLHVRVQAKGSKVADVFLIGYYVGPDNTARMVRAAR